MRFVALLLFAGAAVAQMQPVASIGQIMGGMINPNAQAIAKAATEPPADARAWRGVAQSAAVLAEAGNLLMMEGRATDQNAWMQDSKALSDAAAAVAKAAAASDAAAFNAAAASINETCNTCHAAYRPQRGKKGQ